MILLLLIFIPFIAGVPVWIAGKKDSTVSRIITILALSCGLVISLWKLIPANGSAAPMSFGISWIPQLGIGLNLTADGLSLVLLVLTYFISLLAVLTTNGYNQPGFYYFNILWCVSGISGVFLSSDLFLFYFFWELMIVPMYFLISVWGSGNHVRASYKFFIYTQAGGLLMLLSIVALYLVHGNEAGTYTFNLYDLAGTRMPLTVEILIMSGFLAAFLVKLPAFLFHTWLPDAYTAAPTGGTIILSCLMSKTAAYGLLKLALPLFPQASAAFAPYAMAIGVLGILYGAKLAFSQTDFKRLISWTSLSHMGFIIIGIYSFNELAYNGVIMQMLTHALSTCAMFVIAGQLFIRLNTRDITKMGGLWSDMPRLGAMGMIFSMALLGLPGLGNFIAEFLTLAGAFRASILFTSAACLGLILSTVYSLRIMQKIFFGRQVSERSLRDLTTGELLILWSLVIAVVLTGLFPQLIIDIAGSSLQNSALWIR
ncbi:MAG TPA: NADH-quinone oxidoreductase subunit M [Bacteroidales bacterium]|nr:NADH-quinone oxidoreductase subunit M [Bacteroidales bacterium]